MAEFPTKRIINLGEQSEPQSGDYIVTDNQTSGTKKTPASALAKTADLTAEQTARQQADEAEAQARANAIEAEQTAREEADDALTESITALSGKVDEQGALIQNPTKTVSGSIAHFTDGAEMPAKSVIVNIEPQQSGTGTPSPENVRQISGWTDADVNVSARNIFIGTPGVTVPLFIPKGTTITVSSSDATIVFRYYDKDGNNIDYWSLNNQADGRRYRTFDISTAKDCYFVKFEGNATDLQVEYGSTMTAYEVPHTTTVPLGQTVYGGTLDVVSGVLTVTHEILDLGSLTWQYNGSFGAGGAFYSTDKNFGYTPDSEAPNMVCSMYPVKSRNDLYSSADPAFGVTGNAQTRYATIRDARYTDPTTFKSAVSGVQLVYPTNNPQTYQLTPTEIQTLLGENNVWADAGSVEVTYRRDINLALEQLEALLNS